MRSRVIAGAAALAGGCTLGEAHEPGESVRVGTVAQVASCRSSAPPTAKTSIAVAFFSRSPKKIDAELESLGAQRGGRDGRRHDRRAGPDLVRGPPLVRRVRLRGSETA
jgi:hypothetical protein